MSPNQNVPEIRLHGYDNEWKQYSLEELKESDFTNGVFNDLAKVGSGYRLINVKEMYSGTSIDVKARRD
jgi:type I restriction enzyme S subunit